MCVCVCVKHLYTLTSDMYFCEIIESWASQRDSVVVSGFTGINHANKGKIALAKLEDADSARSHVLWPAASVSPGGFGI